MTSPRNIQARLSSPKANALHLKCCDLVQRQRDVAREEIIFAISELDDVLLKTPEPRLWDDKGCLLMALGDYVSSVECFFRALETTSGEWKYHYHCALACQRTGDYALCLQHCEVIPEDAQDVGRDAAHLKKKAARKLRKPERYMYAHLEVEYAEARAETIVPENPPPVAQPPFSYWDPRTWWTRPAASGSTPPVTPTQNTPN